MTMPGMGYLRDVPDDRDHAFAAPPLAAVELPASFSLRKFVREVLDQGQSSSCVANAYAQAIAVCEALAGLPHDAPARRFIYSMARALTGDEHVDGGAFLRSGAKSLQLVGASSESVWPFDVAKINEMPSLEVRMLGHARKGGRYSRITGTGSTRLHNMRAAIAGRHPFVFGTDVSQSFCNLTGSPRIELPKPGDPIVGGHAMCCVGYDPVGFLIVNSWGRAWRDGGFAWLSNEYMAAAMTSDLWVIEGWKRITDARAAREVA